MVNDESSGFTPADMRRRGEAQFGVTLEEAKALLAAGLAGGDSSALGIARFASVELAVAHGALEHCRAAGFVDGEGVVEPATAALLLADLPMDRAAEVHARAARYWMTVGPDHLLAALKQMRAAGTLMPLEELVDLAERAGQMSLSLHDYASAAELYRVAVDLDPTGNPVGSASRLCDLAVALDGLGMVAEARDCLSRAVALGELAGDGEMVARAAVACALPVDWYAGDSRTAALLARAESMPLSEASEVMVTAARGLAEMRIPVSSTPEHQVAWVTRPAVAHALTEEALARSLDMDTPVRALTHLAWRTTHRAPGFLERRREVSKSALDLSQIVRQPSYQVESAVWLAVDALESADRALYDEALSVVRWVAVRDSNPRLVWRAHTLACGAAHLDGNLEEAEMWRARAREVGEAVSSPGWLAADWFFLGQGVCEHRDPEYLQPYLFDEDFPLLANPIARSLVALVHARCGNAEIAERMARRALRQLDFESSYLLLATRCAAVAEAIGSASLASEIAEILEPWRGHVAVDSNAWWCDGPVERWLAALRFVAGEHRDTPELLAAARPVAQGLNDARSLRALTSLESRYEASGASASPRRDRAIAMTARQERVLALMTEGFTNREIADKLAFSTSTVRVETMAIYRMFGVKSRAEAVAKAVSLRLVPGPV